VRALPVRIAQLDQLTLDPGRAGGAERPCRPAGRARVAAAPVAAGLAAVGAAQLRELVVAVAGPRAGLIIAELALAFQATVDVERAPVPAPEQPDQLHDLPSLSPGGGGGGGGGGSGGLRILSTASLAP
jgi:hypothetical protein